MTTATDETAGAGDPAPAAPSNGPGHGHKARTGVLALGALGVVYGDIGTNPLFAMREAFHAHDLPLNEANVLGLLSLMFWSLILVISLKYLTFVMQADNQGEGGILALTALITRRNGDATRGRTWVLILLGLFGAALLYGDGVITPAISVLSAVEGTAVATPSLESWVVPLACVILVGLFAVQRKGTTTIGRVFGPVMVVWFTTLGVLGVSHLVQRPGVIRAVNPARAVTFFADNGFTGFLVLGAVILVVVGGEALYADMGHFGRRPILLGWYGLVLPSLVLVYFGQGALLLEDPGALEHPFYEMAPEWALYPLVVLATMATVIASQALISGAYSLTRQAIQLGYSPRVDVRHTSATEIGQIYISSINWALMVACIGLVVGFQKSENLAAAYGLAVTTTMVITGVLFYVVGREHFGWSRRWLIPLTALFLTVDLAFFGATLFKIPDGGWFPLVAAILVFTVLSTWRTGRRLVRERLLRGGLPLERFVTDLERTPPIRTPGAGAYLFATPGLTPPALLAALRHHDALHRQVLVIAVVTEDVPRVHKLKRAEVTEVGDGITQVVLHFGFMEDPDVPQALADRVVMKSGVDLDTLTYFIGRESVRVTDLPGMARWRERLFALLHRNAGNAGRYFNLPATQTVEVGTTIEL
jgi:KUP system potassium uptake protein